MGLTRCQQCGCMQEALIALSASLARIDGEPTAELKTQLDDWLREMQQVKYIGLGCAHCYSSAALKSVRASLKESETGSSGCPCDGPLPSGAL